MFEINICLESVALYLRDQAMKEVVFEEDKYPNFNIFKSENTYVIILKPNYAAQFFIYYRIGKRSLMESRQQAALLAAKLMNLYDPSLPATIPVKRITENYESCDEHFRKLFDIRHECPESLLKLLHMILIMK